MNTPANEVKNRDLCAPHSIVTCTCVRKGDRPHAGKDPFCPESLFGEMTGLSEEMMFATDADGYFRYANGSALATFGYSREEIGHINFRQIIDPDWQLPANEMYSRMLARASAPLCNDLLARSRDGRPVWIRVRARPLSMDGRICGVAGVAANLNAHRERENRFSAFEERFLALYRYSPVGMAFYDIDGNLTDHNGSFALTFAGLRPPQYPDFLFGEGFLNESCKERLRRGRPVVARIPLHDTRTDPPTRRLHEWHIFAQRGQAPSSPAFVAQIIDAAPDEEIALRGDCRTCVPGRETLCAHVRGPGSALGDIVSRSPAMADLFEEIRSIADTCATVLITGESGSGKELVARALHSSGCRGEKPFIAVNCGTVPDPLLESELFGYRKGAFTDAKKDKPGRFSLAGDGTIFLDEIGDISFAMQIKLLRVLQEKTFEPLGAIRSETTDARVIAATNRNLAEMVERGEFRKDLFFRLNVVTLHLPALRERKCDIPLLCDHFIRRFNDKYCKQIEGMQDDALDLLMRHDFPGNVRELENMVERAVIFCRGDRIAACDLPFRHKTAHTTDNSALLSNIRSLGELERIYIRSVLEECNNNKTSASKRLGIHKATLFRKLRQLGIQ